MRKGEWSVVMAVKIYKLCNITPQRTQRTQSKGNNVFAHFATFAVSALHAKTTL